jgi:hypothetical protein
MYLHRNEGGCMKRQIGVTLRAIAQGASLAAKDGKGATIEFWIDASNDANLRDVRIGFSSTSMLEVAVDPVRVHVLLFGAGKEPVEREQDSEYLDVSMECTEASIIGKAGGKPNIILNLQGTANAVLFCSEMEGLSSPVLRARVPARVLEDLRTGFLAGRKTPGEALTHWLEPVETV